MKIVVFDDIWICFLHGAKETSNEVRFFGLAFAVRFKYFRRTGRHSNGDHENAVANRIETGCF